MGKTAVWVWNLKGKWWWNSVAMHLVMYICMCRCAKSSKIKDQGWCSITAKTNICQLPPKTMQHKFYRHRTDHPLSLPLSPLSLSPLSLSSHSPSDNFLGTNYSAYSLGWRAPEAVLAWGKMLARVPNPICGGHGKSCWCKISLPIVFSSLEAAVGRYWLANILIALHNVDKQTYFVYLWMKLYKFDTRLSIPFASWKWKVLGIEW